MINCGKYSLTFKYEFYGPCSRQLQQNYHIPNNQLFSASVGLPKYTRIGGFKYFGSQRETKYLTKSDKTKNDLQKQ